MLWRLCGNGLRASQHLTENPSPSQWGESRGELNLQAARQETKQLPGLLLCSSTLPCAVDVAGRVQRCLEPLSPLPFLSAHSLLFCPPCWAPVQAATSALSLCQGGKAVPQTRRPKETFEKGNFNEHLLFHSLPLFTKRLYEIEWWCRITASLIEHKHLLSFGLSNLNWICE